jgi:prepilin-type N-terminal cleavage/methylation domain-containing protein
MKTSQSNSVAKKSGFTLIELMIVVAIIGILASIAIPKFADLIRKSKEGATKGNLGSLRSALSIYYGDMEGTYLMTLPV